MPQHSALVKPALQTAGEANEGTHHGRTSSTPKPVHLKARELVKSAKLGRILNTSMYAHGLIFCPEMADEIAYALPLEARANLVTLPFGHAVDALCYVLGEIDSVTATLANNRPGIKVLDKKGKLTRSAKKTAYNYINVTGTLVNGGVVDVTYAGRTSRTDCKFYWEINGTNGWLVLAASSGHISMFQPSIKLVTGEMQAATLGVLSGKGTHVEEMQADKAGDMDKFDFSFGVGKAWDA